MRPLRSAVSMVLVVMPAFGAVGSSPHFAWQDPATAAAAAVAVERAGCVRCHGGGERRALPRGPRLDDASRWHANDGGTTFLRTHHGGDDAPALAAWVRSLDRQSAEPVAAMPMPGAVARGERLTRELACAACHAPAAFDGLAARVDFDRLAAFLAAPASRFPELAHVPLRADEAADVAAFLLRAQRRDEASASGFRWTAWQVHIGDAGLPDLAGVAVAGSGVTDRIDTTVAPRKTHYALRFDGSLDVPHAGTWKFTVGSDDSSWLWIDDRLLVRNEALAPYRQRSGKVELAAGPHAVTVMFTQAAGGASLDVSWQGPGVDEEPIPGGSVTGRTSTWVPPSLPSSFSSTSPAAALVAQGRAAARARRCDACHSFADAGYAELPAPRPATAWPELREATCSMEPDASSVRAAAASVPRTPAAMLAAAMARDGCLSCHHRDGSPGLSPAMREQLTEVEDLGDEGKLPPDLTAVGRRLRPAWIEKVLRTGHAVRPYVRMRMPGFGEAKAREYAGWFASVDGGAVPATATVPPAPDALLADEVHAGRRLVGLGGRNCITCHTCQGLPSLGPQGMDLAIQYERVQPEWFRDWLLQPAALRPGTRMPALWWQDDATARGEVAAIWSWMALAQAAPLPPGCKAPTDSLQLVPSDRPRLHGAFLDGVSARCLAVGTPERTHFAFDLTRPALVWLWRGAFLDASGTWSGRAGKLLRPLGSDHRVLADVVVMAGAPRRLLGRRLSDDGYPVLRVAVGDAEYEDTARARLAVGGSEVVRTLRCVKGPLELEFSPAAEGVTLHVGDAPAGRHRLTDGESLEVVYRW